MRAPFPRCAIVVAPEIGTPVGPLVGPSPPCQSTRRASRRPYAGGVRLADCAVRGPTATLLSARRPAAQLPPLVAPLAPASAHRCSSSATSCPRVMVCTCAQKSSCCLRDNCHGPPPSGLMGHRPHIPRLLLDCSTCPAAVPQHPGPGPLDPGGPHAGILPTGSPDHLSPGGFHRNTRRFCFFPAAPFLVPPSPAPRWGIVVCLVALLGHGPPCGSQARPRGAEAFWFRTVSVGPAVPVVT